MTFDRPTLPAIPARIALLVDGENISATLSQAILAEVRSFGEPSIRRVYGKAEHIAAWDAEGFRLVPTRPGKNAADLLLTVEAMSLALRDGVGVLCLASSDGDFTYLATHLRETGCTVIGLGEVKAPAAFRTACSRFIGLRPQTEGEGPKWPATKIIPQVREILSYSNRPEGWGEVKWIAHHLRSRDPEFDSRHYGHPTLETLIDAVRFFETRQTSSGMQVRDPHRKPVTETTAPLPHTAP